MRLRLPAWLAWAPDRDETSWAYKLGLARGRKTGRSKPNASDWKHLHTEDTSDRRMFAAGMAATARRSSARTRKGR